MTAWHEKREQKSITHKFVIAGQRGYLTTVFDERCEPQHVFIEIDREGSGLGGWVRAWAILLSVALQGGTPLSKLVTQFRGWSFGISGATNNEDILIAQSIPDYIVRWLEHKSAQLKKEQQK
jgi:hypothetical protein